MAGTYPVTSGVMHREWSKPAVRPPKKEGEILGQSKDSGLPSPPGFLAFCNCFHHSWLSCHNWKFSKPLNYLEVGEKLWLGIRVLTLEKYQLPLTASALIRDQGFPCVSWEGYSQTFHLNLETQGSSLFLGADTTIYIKQMFWKLAVHGSNFSFPQGLMLAKYWYSKQTMCFIVWKKNRPP